ncbi:hypothetical protein RB595_001710 [Gaeumannomyces hyphopodioides]
MMQSTAWKRAGSIAQQARPGRACGCRRSKSTTRAATSSATSRTHVSTRGSAAAKAVDLGSLWPPVPRWTTEQSSEDRDLLKSVFESSPTKRDTRQYLQSFGPAVAARSAKPKAPSHEAAVQEATAAATTGPNTFAQDKIPHVALVKIREPQSINDEALRALGKTLLQLRALGMPSIVVIDCEREVASSRAEWWSTVVEQTERVLAATGKGRHSRVVDSLLGIAPTTNPSSRFLAGGIFVAFEEPLISPLRDASIVVVPSYATSTDTSIAVPINSNGLILALAKYLTGMQFLSRQDPAATAASSRPMPKATVARVILIDPLGGTPARNRPNGAHIFLNMTDEFDSALEDIQTTPDCGLHKYGSGAKALSADFIRKKHSENLELTRNILAMLPSTSSVLMTTPEEAASINIPRSKGRDNEAFNQDFGFLGTTGTRKAKNPLIYSLLTDRSVLSSSLPLGRIAAPRNRKDITEREKQPQQQQQAHSPQDSQPRSRTTLAKRGLPLTIIPDPRQQLWVPPSPGAPRLRLTDTCIDLPRLVHLIDDSFGRPLDVRDYLERVNDSLAGIIIAGEYEGGAILTWEAPAGLSLEEAQRQGRLVPYLDKFAVLRKSQGAGGVADMVFNAMVRTCFPEGVCWRSRKDNPVNRWYFERSRGFKRLEDSNWAMFWTTPDWDQDRLADYEDVCRRVQPSWADNKHIVD